MKNPTEKYIKAHLKELKEKLQSHQKFSGNDEVVAWLRKLEQDALKVLSEIEARKALIKKTENEQKINQQRKVK